MFTTLPSPTLTASGFSLSSLIAALFNGGQQGAWYAPSDFTTLFQDSAGTTPVTAVEQLVGLALDKRLGLVRGPELVSNGTFDANTTGWATSTSYASTSAAVNGVMQVTSTAAFGRQIATVNVVVGKTYSFSGSAYTVSGGGSARLQINSNNIGADGGAAVVVINATTTPQVGTTLFVATAAIMYIAAGSDTLNAVTAFDNISVKLLDGNHASQATAAARPPVSARVNLLRSTDSPSSAPWGMGGLAVGAVVSGFARLTESAGAGTHELYQDIPILSGQPCVYTRKYKPDSRRYVRHSLATAGFGNGFYVDFDLTAGSIISTGTVGTGTYLSSSVVANADGSFDVSVVGSIPATLAFVGTALKNDAVNTAGAPSYTGDGVSGFFAGAPQAQYGSVATRYQRVNTATDYDTAGFPVYLKPDGIDDSLSSATGGGGTAGFFLCQAIKPTGGAGTVRTIWSDAQANAGYRVRLNAANLLELSAGNGTPLAPPVQAAATTSTTGGTGLAASTAYFYVVTAFNAAGESLRSNEVSATTSVGTTDSVTLSWAASVGATSYKVYRGTTTGVQTVGYVLGNVLTFVDTGAAATAGAPPTVSETAYTKAAAATATVIGTTALLTVWDDGTNLNAQLDSGAVATIARPVVVAGTAGFTVGKDNGAATGFYTGNLYAEIYRQIVPTTSERATIQSYCRQQAGL